LVYLILNAEPSPFKIVERKPGVPSKIIFIFVINIPSMKKIIFIALFFYPLIASSQVVFWTETFNNGCTKNCLVNGVNTGNGAWTLSLPSGAGGMGPCANQFFVSCAENGQAVGGCGIGCGNNATLHIGNVPCGLFFVCPGGDCGAAYNAGGCFGCCPNSDERADSPIISTVGKSGITYSFKFIMKGQAGVDYASAYYNAIGVWTALPAIPLSGTCGAQGKWALYSTLLPASCDNNPNLRVGIRWVNNNSTGADPSFAADDLQLSYNATLPVELTQFTGKVESSKVHLQWITVSETESDHFEIESGSDGEEFSSIGKINSHGNSTVMHEYDFYDSKPSDEMNYYRLKTVDKNGEYGYSKVIAVNFNAASVFDFNIYPVPAENKIYISSFYQSEVPVTFAIVDLTGRKIKELFNGKMISGTVSAFNVTSLDKGIYFLKIASADGREQVKRIVKN
jgi:hypothetical protein